MSIQALSIIALQKEEVQHTGTCIWTCTLCHSNMCFWQERPTPERNPNTCNDIHDVVFKAHPPGIAAGASGNGRQAHDVRHILGVVLNVVPEAHPPGIAAQGIEVQHGLGPYGQRSVHCALQPGGSCQLLLPPGWGRAGYSIPVQAPEE